MDARAWHTSWPRGLPLSLDYPRVPVYKFLESSARKYPTRQAIIFQVGEGTTSYPELWEKARRFATALSSLGVKKGDVVAIQLPNSPQFAIAYYGTLLLGATFSPCNPLLSAPELRHQLRDSGAETLVALDMFIDSAISVRGETSLKRVVVTGIQEIIPPFAPVDVSAHGPDTYSFQKLLLDFPPEPPEVGIDPDRDIAHLAYTGGTTGVSKGVVLTHKAIVANTLQFAHWLIGGRPAYDPEADLLLEPLGLPETDDQGFGEFPVTVREGKTMIVVPWFHAMGTVGYLNEPIYLGTTMVVHPRFDPGAYMGDISRHGAVVFGGAPPLFQAMLNHPDIDKSDFSSVRFVASGAAPLPVELLTEMQRRLPHTVIMEAYGLSEMSMGATANPCNRSGVRKLGSVGIPIFDTDVKIVDAEDPGRVLGAKEPGEICLKGPQAMLGYLGRPDETAEVLRDGWVHTGDIGYMDEDGYVYVIDRKKDMLIYKGYNVYPRELEEILFTHPAVANCAVIGKPDPAVGEYPKAFIVLKPGAVATPEEIMDHVARQVTPYKKIREVEFLDEIPVSLAGKALKRELREREAKRSRTA
ncbi:MAG: acyl-CoA synthetase [Bacillota bacterium]|nr:MAG: acyl-CoA synthetase [Bacillota bacterium]